MAVRLGWSKLSERRFYKEVVTSLPQEEQNVVQAAYVFASNYHKGQTRKSGEPFIVHPVGIALRLAEVYKNSPLICAALLHDTVEDCPEVHIEMIYEQFGDEIGFLVDAMTKDRSTFYNRPNVHIEDNIERLLWAGLQDVRVLLIKIADRENNLETIRSLKRNRQVRMAFETQAIYQPLKKILGYGESGISLEEVAVRLRDFMKKHSLASAKEFKEILMNQSFTNINNDLFGLVYKDSQSIVWKITSRQTYQKICDNESLKDMIRFLSVEGNSNWFLATFQFSKGAVIPGNVKIGISSYRS